MFFPFYNVTSCRLESAACRKGKKNNIKNVKENDVTYQLVASESVLSLNWFVCSINNVFLAYVFPRAPNMFLR